tara:strand:- start:74 stop:310 length:237 start_codon:yes stop_codon:yes gene_type:complete
MARPKPRGFGSDMKSPVNQEAERIVRGMKRKSAHRFKELYGKRDREVMYATANKLATKEQVKMAPTYNQLMAEFRKSK